MINSKKEEKDIILFVGPVPLRAVLDVKNYAKKNKRNFKIAVIFDERMEKTENMDFKNEVDILIPCKSSADLRVAQALMPYKERILAVTCRSEKSIPLFKKVIPNLPYLRTPTTESLTWSTDKISMRKRMYLYDRKIIPAFKVIHDASQASIKTIEEKVGFPVIVKPAGLAQSMLVSICYHKDELKKVLNNTFKKINKVLKDENRNEVAPPNVLVEQFIEGEMYSVDAYVTSRGKVYFCPFVHIKTGRSIGFDDFFGYQQITPTLLKAESIKAGEEVAKKAIHALGLRSTSAHIELIKTEAGWKVVEVGPRVGGFRQKMYELSYGIDHTMNDILIRIPEKPKIPKRVKGYTAALKFFAKKEGRLTKLTGIKKAQTLKSFQHISINKKIGDRCVFAKNGGKSVFNITLFNKNRSDLLADIRRLETMIKIETE